jgi:hypothetical protein
LRRSCSVVKIQSPEGTPVVVVAAVTAASKGTLRPRLYIPADPKIVSRTRKEKNRMKVKSASQAQANYTSAAALVPARYEAGVSTADWQAKALDGQTLYVAKLQDPEVLARRAKNIGKVSDSDWRSNTITKGRGIIGARMTAAAPKQQANWAPYRSALEAVTLPPKTADPMSNLMNRAGAVVQAMVNTKKSVG